MWEEAGETEGVSPGGLRSLPSWRQGEKMGMGQKNPGEMFRSSLPQNLLTGMDEGGVRNRNNSEVSSLNS